ncbi:MAG TPA: SulP family inorganic anion transporter, partial [Burkholderiaceae bacterium]|nr:SulP family inorganic anion transporter [Burkholderiaceae bacterium]
GTANLATGLLQGFPVSSSASRTPVAQAAGARTQATGLVGAAAIVVLLLAAPGLLRDLPVAALAAVVISACLSFADVR